MECRGEGKTRSRQGKGGAKSDAGIARKASKASKASEAGRECVERKERKGCDTRGRTHFA